MDTSLIKDKRKVHLLEALDARRQQLNPVVHALDETINDPGILPYKTERKNIYTLIRDMDMTPADQNKRFNIYTELGLK